MQNRQIPAFFVLTMLLLIAPMMGVDCNETGDLLRGPESRNLAAAALTQISSGLIDALVIAVTNATFGVTP